VTIDQALTWMQGTHLSRAVSKSNPLVIAWVQVLHIAGFVLLLSAVTVSCLRKLDLVLSSEPVAGVFRETKRLLWLGLCLVVVSGALMFVGSPKHYFFNRAFDAKMSLLLVALVYHVTVIRPAFGRDGDITFRGRANVLIWVALWFAVGIAGRAIGFVQ
jgi:hypothetical protein